MYPSAPRLLPANGARRVWSPDALRICISHVQIRSQLCLVRVRSCSKGEDLRVHEATPLRREGQRLRRYEASPGRLRRSHTLRAPVQVYAPKSRCRVRAFPRGSWGHRGRAPSSRLGCRVSGGISTRPVGRDFLQTASSVDAGLCALRAMSHLPAPLPPHACRERQTYGRTFSHSNLFLNYSRTSIRDALFREAPHFGKFVSRAQVFS